MKIFVGRFSLLLLLVVALEANGKASKGCTSLSAYFNLTTIPNNNTRQQTAKKSNNCQLSSSFLDALTIIIDNYVDLINLLLVLAAMWFSCSSRCFPSRFPPRRITTRSCRRSRAALFRTCSQASSLLSHFITTREMRRQNFSVNQLHSRFHTERFQIISPDSCGC